MVPVSVQVKYGSPLDDLCKSCKYSEKKLWSSPLAGQNLFLLLRTLMKHILLYQVLKYK